MGTGERLDGADGLAQSILKGPVVNHVVLLDANGGWALPDRKTSECTSSYVLPEDIAADVDLISRIEAVPTILEVVCRTTGMGFAAVARVTEERWVACGVRDEIEFGLQPGGELKVETTICHEIRANHRAVVIESVAGDPLYAKHHTPALYGIQSYISMPIVLADGEFFGTLCAIDPKPHKFSDETLSTIRLFTDLIAFHIDAHRQLTSASEALNAERGTADLREQFIAVLGHDLRNPLASVDAAAQLLLKTPLNERATRIVGTIQSSVTRMADMIDDVMDFARGRLGGGLSLDRDVAESLGPLLVDVVTELRLAHPERSIQADIEPISNVSCDSRRIQQLVSNLLANALTHGASDKPVRVAAAAHETVFEVSVSNSGAPIPAETIAGLFKPFVRTSARPSLKGLGLGLYIASEIASAHSGTLTATSDEQETRFTFRMPIRPA